jgi:tetratricopeptide (TPR) repeat protein
MTMLLAHPEAEDLGRFVEGTLDDPERAAVVQHIADCDDCRILVVDAAEFIEPARVASSHWWVGIAAAVVLVALLGGVSFNHFRDPVAQLAASTAGLQSRPVEARLSGFPYREWHVNRGGVEGDSNADPAVLRLEVRAGELLQRTGNGAEMLHSHGLAHLLINERKEAVVELAAAALKRPTDAHYWSDLAAAHIASGEHGQALSAADHALAIDPRSTEALFNRALALERLDRTVEAITAYKKYVAIDPASPWANDARNNLEHLRELHD